MIYVGVDPGLSGAIVEVGAHGNFLAVQRITPMPIVESAKGRDAYDLPAINRLFLAWRKLTVPCALMIERQQPMPLDKGGTIANYNRGRSMAVFEALAVAHEIPYQLVPPRTWQAVMHAGVQGDDTKQKSIIAAQRLCPSVSLKRTERSRKDDDNIADAILLALYARKVMQ